MQFTTERPIRFLLAKTVSKSCKGSQLEGQPEACLSFVYLLVLISEDNIILKENVVQSYSLQLWLQILMFPNTSLKGVGKLPYNGQSQVLKMTSLL